MRNNEIKAVNTDDIRDLLESLEVLDDVMKGLKKCIFCGDEISINNIDAILPVKNNIEFSCTKKECHTSLLIELGGEHNGD